MPGRNGIGISLRNVQPVRLYPALNEWRVTSGQRPSTGAAGPTSTPAPPVADQGEIKLKQNVTFEHGLWSGRQLRACRPNRIYVLSVISEELVLVASGHRCQSESSRAQRDSVIYRLLSLSNELPGNRSFSHWVQLPLKWRSATRQLSSVIIIVIVIEELVVVPNGYSCQSNGITRQLSAMIVIEFSPLQVSYKFHWVQLPRKWINATRQLSAVIVIECSLPSSSS